MTRPRNSHQRGHPLVWRSLFSFVPLVGLVALSFVVLAQQNRPYHPFVAQEEVWVTRADGTRTRTVTTIYSDSAPRQRLDSVTYDASGNVIGQRTRIFDPVAGVSHTLNHAKRTAVRQAFNLRPPSPGQPRPNVPFGTEPWQPNARVSGTRLETKWIATIECQGRRQVIRYPSATGSKEESVEIWTPIDPDLPCTCEEIHVSPTGQKVHQRLLWIRAGEEPSPSLFSIPQDYTVMSPPDMRR